MRAARVVAQAKVNLFLHVLAREESGYHALETLFQRLDLGDQVTVRVEVPGRSLDSGDADLGPVERNLAWRAALAYADATGWPDGFAIELDKRVPVGGGLGGGSADAGAVLRILNRLAPSPLAEDRLLALALALGADVPFLTTTAVRALGWGRGERMLALPPLPPRQVLLLMPAAGVSTAEAFRWLRESRAGSAALPPRLLRSSALATWAGVASLSANDFEPVVAAHVPAVAALAAMASEAVRENRPAETSAILRMSGSGSTWFLLPVHDGDPPPLVPPPGCRAVPTTTADRVAEVVEVEEST